MFKEDLLNSSHKLYRQDPLVNSIYEAIGDEFGILASDLQDNLNQFDFTKMTWGIPILENLLDFKVNSNNAIEDQRSQLMSKWRSNGKVDVLLLQNITNSWKNGDAKVDFDNGEIEVQFIGEYGIPQDLDGLKQALELTKPAQFKIVYSFRYLTVDEVQNMTIEQLEQTLISKFAF
jgi:Uncharacterized protein conserved in bacteria (DUF2313).